MHKALDFLMHSFCEERVRLLVLMSEDQAKDILGTTTRKN